MNRLTFSRTGLAPRDLSLTIEATGQLATIPNVKITATPNRTVLETQIPSTTRPVASMLLNPPRLVIDFRSDAPPRVRFNGHRGYVGNSKPLPSAVVSFLWIC